MFNKVKLSSICLLFAALLFVGCKSDDNITPDKPEEQEEWPDSRDVYVAGYVKVIVPDNYTAQIE